jgi:hypothetical protein
MAFHKITWTSVGADVSALRGFHDIPPILFILIIGLRALILCKNSLLAISLVSLVTELL